MAKQLCCNTCWYLPTALLVAVLAACVPFGRAVGPTPTPNASLVDMSIFTGLPCAAPCWYGLEPGRSTKEQVLTTVQTLPFIDPKGTKEEPYYFWGKSKSEDRTGTFLRLGCRRPDGGTCASLLLFEGVLKTIYLTPPPSLTFGRVVEHFGPPDAVRATPLSAENAVTCTLGMIWEKRAIWVAFVNTPPKEDQVRCSDAYAGRSIDPELPVGQIIYAAPDDRLFAAPIGTAGTLRWPGFAE